MSDPRPNRPSPSTLRTLLQSEANSGLVLMASAAAALAVANSQFGPAYFGMLDSKIAGLSLLHWINDALMALFFLLVGLEIKREFLDGQLASWPRRTLPVVAAAGGMIVPALIYVALNASQPANLRGWAIPTATDIAFALGVLALLGSRIPVSLKVFLTALAIIDDLGAVIIIAAVYTTGIQLVWLGLAFVSLIGLWGLNRSRVEQITPYLAIGGLLWFAVLRSGVHATLAGVALAAVIPLRRSPGRPDDAVSPLHRLEHALQPWVAYLVLPVFGFANAGVSLSGQRLTVLVAQVPLGIAAGLFVGKQLGVFSFTWAAIRLGIADRPKDASLAQLYGVCILCGIGFTMSLFIGLLAFPGAATLQDQVKLGVLGGSLCSALLGVVVLLLASRRSSCRIRDAQLGAPT
jgi:NhaA family Na+:H+ antiporter